MRGGVVHQIGSLALTQFLTFHLQVTAKKLGTKSVSLYFLLEHNIRWMTQGGSNSDPVRSLCRPSSGVFYTMQFLNHLAS
jgi:hypothetical protein